MKIIPLILIGLISNAYAEDSSVDGDKSKKAHVNITCPATKLLPLLDTTYHDCSTGYGGEVSCEQFVDTYKQLLPKYDCQYTDELGNEWKVSALFMGRSAGATEDYTGLLWRLASAKEANFKEERIPNAVAKARMLFTSREFRKILDGDLAETFLDRSKQIEREMRKAKR